MASPKLNHWLGKLAAELAGNSLDEVPEGFKTSPQWAREMGWGLAHTKCVLAGGIKAGRIEARSFKIRYPSGAVHRSVHYREAR